MDFFACFVAGFLGTALANFLHATFFRDAPGEMPHHVSANGQQEPEVSESGHDVSRETSKRKPFYGTPEKAALAEQGRGLPPQWQKRG